jgi:hypothetical protein
MRKLSFLLLPLLATSCVGSPWDGFYKVVLSFDSWTCTGASEPFPAGYQETSHGRLSVRHTTADSMVINFGNLILVGPHEGRSFTVSASEGVTDSACTRYDYGNQWVFDGEFTKDLGITGTIKVTETMVREGCQGSQDYN